MQKAIEHLAKNKTLYFILIGLLGLTGIAMLFDFSGSQNEGTLQGNVEELVEDSPTLSIVSPLNDAVFSEGEVVEVEWDYTEALAATTYRVFAQETDVPEAPILVIEEQIVGTSTSLTIDYDTLSEMESNKTFTLTVAVNGTDLEESVQLTVESAQEPEEEAIEAQLDLEGLSPNQQAELDLEGWEDDFPQAQLDLDALNDDEGVQQAELDLGSLDEQLNGPFIKVPSVTIENDPLKDVPGFELN